MVTAALLDPDLDLRTQIGWAVRLSAARDSRLILLFPVNRRGETGVTDVGPDTDPDELPKVAVSAREVLGERPDVRLTAGGEEDEAGERDEDGETEGDGVAVTLRLVLDENVGRALLAELQNDKAQLFTLFCEGLEATGSAVNLRQFLAGRVMCELMLLRLGQTMPESCRRILVPSARRLHARAALQLGNDLAISEDGRVTALYVEPDVGLDAKAVGRRIINRVITQAIGKERERVLTRVVVGGDVQKTISELSEKDEFDLVILGASERGALSPRTRGSLQQRIMRAHSGPAVAIVRAAVPFANRLRARVEELLTTLVPQLDRDHRITLVERIQSNSQWDFDFITLMGLSTLIAGLGLLSNSAAVVIGAMLVAPLMTPLLGVALALVQGNPVLVRLGMRSILFGFVLALLLATLLGWAQPGRAEMTEEMLARGWPGMRELFVAFASGLAAAYASSRPAMVAALPGVAIAAALVPPIATCGLALSAGRIELAIGAFLLVFTNMVVIVFAATISLWSVGIRSVKHASPWTSRTGATLMALVGLVGVLLSISPIYYAQRGIVPPELHSLVRTHVFPRYRIADMRVARRDGTARLEVDLGGDTPPSRDLAERIAKIANPYFEGDVRVRLALRWEVASRE